MRAQRAKKIGLRGATKVSVGGEYKFWRWGGTGLHGGGTTPGWGGPHPIPPPHSGQSCYYSPIQYTANIINITYITSNILLI